MGEACEHYLYDKGYGPTNLTLKQHLHALFPSAAIPADDGQEFVLSTPLPVEDADRTPVSSIDLTFTRQLKDRLPPR
jgi:hypothetical protein